MEWISSNNQTDKSIVKKILFAWSPFSTDTWSAYRAVVCLSPWVKAPRSDELALLHVCKYSDVCVTRLFDCLDICLGNGLLFIRGYFLLNFIFCHFVSWELYVTIGPWRSAIASAACADGGWVGERCVHQLGPSIAVYLFTNSNCHSVQLKSLPQ